MAKHRDSDDQLLRFMHQVPLDGHELNRLIRWASSHHADLGEAQRSGGLLEDHERLAVRFLIAGHGVEGIASSPRHGMREEQRLADEGRPS